MANEAQAENQAANLAQVDTATVLETFHKGFNQLPRMLEGMDRGFRSDFPFYTPLNGIGRRILQRFSRKPSDQISNPIRMDSITGIKQQSNADCVGASFMSVFSEITGVSVTPELYDGFLQTALRHKLATQEGQGVKVEPFVFNVLSAPEFKKQFPSSEVTVALKRGLSLNQIFEIIQTTKDRKNPSYKLFTFLPFPSWTKEGGGHMVTLQEVTPTEVTLYDPNLGEQRIIGNEEFNERWKYDNKSAIFVFAKTK